jgi:hypothetical protein
MRENQKSKVKTKQAASLTPAANHYVEPAQKTRHQPYYSQNVGIKRVVPTYTL